MMTVLVAFGAVERQTKFRVEIPTSKYRPVGFLNKVTTGSVFIFSKHSSRTNRNKLMKQFIIPEHKCRCRNNYFKKCVIMRNKRKTRNVYSTSQLTRRLLYSTTHYYMAD